MDTRTLLQKRIPTIIGLIVLFVALGAGVFLTVSGPGIFAPRATPQTTPKNVKVTNRTDSTFTISFLTDDTVAGFVKYGTSPTSLSLQASDDRDERTGNVGTYQTHHITLRNLQPNTTYYFTLGTGNNQLFDNSGTPYSVKTLQKSSGNTISQTIYGTVLTADSAPAEGSIVYAAIEGAEELSSQVRSTGTWAIPLSQLRSVSGGNAPQITTNTPIRIFVQGPGASQTSTLTTTVGQPQFPIQTITLGQDSEGSSPVVTPTIASTVTTTPSAGTDNEPVVSASGSATTATPTRAITTTVTVTSRPATPTVTLKDDTSLPATNSPQPVSGATENTFAILLAGTLFLSFGGLLFLHLKSE